MPGYLISQSGGAGDSKVFSQESDDFNEAYGKIFYGFKVNPSNGKLTVSEINDSTEIIRLPEEDKIDSTDYRTWVWSKRRLLFSWDQSKKTNALMEIL